MSVCVFFHTSVVLFWGLCFRWGLGVWVFRAYGFSSYEFVEKLSLELSGLSYLGPVLAYLKLQACGA